MPGEMDSVIRAHSAWNDLQISWARFLAELDRQESEGTAVGRDDFLYAVLEGVGWTMGIAGVRLGEVIGAEPIDECHSCLLERVEKNARTASAN